MQHWSVASAIVEDRGAMLLVANRRRNGSIDWSPPGGVVDPGESTTDALGREVLEETGLQIVELAGPVYSIRVDFVELRWDLRVEVHLAETWSGDLTVDDPDGIVVDAAFVDAEQCRLHLGESPRWVAEPVCEWLTDRWTGSREFAYRVLGSDRPNMTVERT